MEPENPHIELPTPAQEAFPLLCPDYPTCRCSLFLKEVLRLPLISHTFLVHLKSSSFWASGSFGPRSPPLCWSPLYPWAATVGQPLSGCHGGKNPPAPGSQSGSEKRHSATLHPPGGWRSSRGGPRNQQKRLVWGEGGGCGVRGRSGEGCCFARGFFSFFSQIKVIKAATGTPAGLQRRRSPPHGGAAELRCRTPLPQHPEGSRRPRPRPAHGTHPCPPPPRQPASHPHPAPPSIHPPRTLCPPSTHRPTP